MKKYRVEGTGELVIDGAIKPINISTLLETDSEGEKFDTLVDMALDSECSDAASAYDEDGEAYISWTYQRGSVTEVKGA